MDSILYVADLATTARVLSIEKGLSNLNYGLGSFHFLSTEPNSIVGWYLSQKPTPAFQNSMQDLLGNRGPFLPRCTCLVCCGMESENGSKLSVARMFKGQR